MSEADKTAYLKEAMRLVELRIEEQNASNATLENKAGLLGTFCVVVIGYVGSTEFHAFQICGISESIGKGILLTLGISGIIPLAGAIAYSISILKLARFIRRGSTPESVLDPYYGYSCDKFIEKYLNLAEEEIQKSTDIIEKKGKRLEAAYRFLIVGLIFSFAFILMHQIARVLS